MRKEMKGFCINKVLVAVLASFFFMAGVRVAVNELYPDGKDNLSKGKIVVVPQPARTAMAR